MKDDELEIYKKIIDFYGKAHQKNKAMEELAELIAAIAREDVDNIAEEMGDVKNIINQLEIIYNNNLDVETHRINKLRRTEYRIGEKINE